MESKIQPILCCVGTAVAGRPTQFLMERAFEAARCDWRVITVEVQPESFQIALDGMQAMAFTAIRFFPELQPLAASRLQEESKPSFKAVTSAMRQKIKGGQHHWEYWDNQGYGMLELIANSVPASNTLLWLHGWSRLTQSLFDAMQATSFTPSQLLWSAHEAPASDMGGMPPIVTPVDEVHQKLKEALALPGSLTHVVVIGEGLVDQLALIHDLEVTSEIQLLLATNQLLTRQQVNEAWSHGKVKVFTENDQLLAAEAYDFKRWTGQQADMDLLRDAYDEYADF